MKRLNDLHSDHPNSIIWAVSRTSAVKRLLEFAKTEQATAIALSTHGRAGLEGLVLGRFFSEQETYWCEYMRGLFEGGLGRNVVARGRIELPTLAL